MRQSDAVLTSGYLNKVRHTGDTSAEYEAEEAEKKRKHEEAKKQKQAVKTTKKKGTK